MFAANRPEKRGEPGDESWAELTDLFDQEFDRLSLAEKIKGKSDMLEKNPSHIPDVLLDKWNAEMFDQVRPRYWKDPGSKDEKTATGDGPMNYDMVVIGGGAAGMSIAASSAIFGAKTCMIEKNAMGGDCLYTGCVPSKAFLKASNAAQKAKNASKFGIEVGEVKVNFPKLMERLREVRAKISHHDSVTRFQDMYGLDIFLGEAQFIDRDKVKINGKEIKFINATIATGGRPIKP